MASKKSTKSTKKQNIRFPDVNVVGEDEVIDKELLIFQLSVKLELFIVLKVGNMINLRK